MSDENILPIIRQRIRSKKLASLLGVSARKITDMAMAGEIPARKIGHIWTFDPVEIKQWLENPRLNTCRKISIKEVMHSTPVSLLTGKSNGLVYEQAIYGRRRKDLKPSGKKP